MIFQSCALKEDVRKNVTAFFRRAFCNENVLWQEFMTYDFKINLNNKDGTTQMA